MAAERKILSEQGGYGYAHVGRTVNTHRMSVTLAVSKLSGWLNTLALCRGTRRYTGEGDMRARRRGGVGRWQREKAARRAQKRAGRAQLEGRARTERTANIFSMLVTPDVSRLSGWLNSHAPW